MMPKISIVIPVKNGIGILNQCLDAIQKQTIFKDCEVVIVDSGSTDGTIAMLKTYDVTLVSIPPETFNHGATRNLGVTHAKGEFVVMTVQDAVPTNEFWLENMLRHFKDDHVSGVCGQQVIPHHKNKNPHEWFRPQSNPKSKTIHFKSKQAFDELSPEEKRNVCGWDDVNAMYRKTALEAIPFETIAFGEDMLWAKAALEQGHKLVYDHAVRVYHYHYQFPDYTYRRTMISKVFIYKCFGYAVPHKFTLKDYALVIYRNFKWKLHPKWIWHNLKIVYYQRKATNDFLRAIMNNTLSDLEQSLALNIPIGQQKK
ncbi:glycosyltransferase family 2 protein [uncultured Psychroserpens sp.]|uniref:glycosyltransferase family 2 protein n=1 Tax=uncultured Psychroserpens sp. TaxID=255436 RepID=UPI002604974F|nr:glycosyltransferase family 2 protein [uncultured Psychroserpens sp.]